MSTTNIFDRAREVLRERGWRQGGVSGEGPVCILGALAVAKGMDAYDWADLDRSTPEVVLIARVVHEQYQCSGTWTWNDRKGTTLADVDLILDKCGRVLDEQATS